MELVGESIELTSSLGDHDSVKAFSDTGVGTEPRKVPFVVNRMRKQELIDEIKFLDPNFDQEDKKVAELKEIYTYLLARHKSGYLKLTQKIEDDEEKKKAPVGILPVIALMRTLVGKDPNKVFDLLDKTEKLAATLSLDHIDLLNTYISLISE